jgi:hypothetical protein
MAPVGQLIVVRVGVAIPARVVRDTMVREVRHTKVQEARSIVAQEALLTTVPVVRHIQDQAAPATLVRAVLAIRVLVGQVKTALRYADDT